MKKVLWHQEFDGPEALDWTMDVGEKLSGRLLHLAEIGGTAAGVAMVGWTKSRVTTMPYCGRWKFVVELGV